MIANLTLRWPWNPIALGFLLLLCVCYLLAWRRARRDTSGESAPGFGHMALFFSGIVLSALLLLTPIDTVARVNLFSVHMMQLVLLTTACAPLLLAGSPAALSRPLVELPGLRQVVAFFTRPLVASVLFNFTFLLWHTPRIFNAALANEELYHLQVLSIFCFALLNWYPLIGSLHELRKMSYPVQMAYAFFDGQPVDIFAFVLVFSGVALYSHYAVPPEFPYKAFGDQAVGGVLLLIPGLVDLAVMSPLFFRWLGQIERHTELGDRRRQAELEDDEEWEEEEEEDSEGEASTQMPHQAGKQVSP